jgi:type VI secretion system protein ImpF
MRSSSELPVTLSVLDRLIDNEPLTATETPLSRAQSVRALRSAVRRDLEWLLNTRRISVEPDLQSVHLNQSLYVFGLRDVTTFSLANPEERMRLLRHIEATIEQFEPRLASIRITQEEDSFEKRQFRFRIDASLLMDPAPESVSFDSTLQLSSGPVLVRENF